MDNSELGRWLVLRRAGFGSHNFALLLRRFGAISAAWEAPADELARAGIDQSYIRAMARARETWEPADEVRLTEEAGARTVTWMDAEYPALLRDIPQSPPVLIVRGSIGPGQPLAVAVVGTRRVTPYGRQVTEQFCEGLSAAGVTIVSGLARGVDAIAHRVAVERGTPTVGVLAGGIDEIYPREHEGLAGRIAERGCIASEYPIGIPARPDYFPRRNRILSGLAVATLVTEAGEGSGALHTANWAFEQGRDVFAVPGSVLSRQSVGCHRIIRDHVARLVTTPEELLAEIQVLAPGSQYPMERPFGLRSATPAQVLEPDEAAIVSALGAAPQHIDEVARATGQPVARLAALLALLELRGIVEQGGPMTYALATRAAR